MRWAARGEPKAPGMGGQGMSGARGKAADGDCEWLTQATEDAMDL